MLKLIEFIGVLGLFGMGLFSALALAFAALSTLIPSMTLAVTVTGIFAATSLLIVVVATIAAHITTI